MESDSVKQTLVEGGARTTRRPFAAMPPIRLRDRSHGTRTDRVSGSFADCVDEVVQRSIRIIRRNRSENITDLESLTFVKTLAQVSGERKLRISPELELLAEPVGLYEFRLRDRIFSCIEHPLEAIAVADEAEPARLNRRSVHRLLSSAQLRTAELQQQEAELNCGEAQRRPLTLELVTTMLAHLDEVAAQPRAGDRSATGSVAAADDPSLHPVHPARRATIREWAERQEALCRERYRHACEETSSTYPIVDAVAFDSGYLALILMSQLNANYIDEKVPPDQRVHPVTLAVYNVRNRFSQTVLDSALPLLRQGFARLLFTHTADLNGHALNVSFGEAGKILRSWVRQASDGLRGLLDADDLNRPFDPFLFCRAVVESVLCRIPEVETEVYPFDRVLIFREAGVKDLSAGEDEGGVEQRQTEPIEMLVLEASVVSNNPADRGRYLTRRERQLRDTQDFECDSTEKKIRDCFRFYVHGYHDSLILSRRRRVSDREKEEATRAEYRSRRSQNQPDRELYYIGRADRHELEEVDAIDAALYNLFGRIVGTAIEEKKVLPPLVPGEAEKPPLKTVAFRDEFRKVRLHVLDRFDQDGLYFEYGHGLDLQRQVPLLHQLLAAYNEYLDDKFRKEEEHFLREKYLEDSLSHNQIDELIRLHQHKKNVEKRQRRTEGEASAGTAGAQRQRAKAVYISFSPWLHEENARKLVADQTRSRDGDDAGDSRMLLGDEFSFTMLLVADQDIEKNQARLQAERNDLKLYFQMLLRQIWMDTLSEHESLARKSRTLGECLTQLLHRAKGLLPKEAHRERGELDDLFAGLRKLTAYEASALVPLEVRDGAGLFGQLLGKTFANQAAVGEALRERAASWGVGRVEVELGPSPLPRLELSWSEAVARDAFAVILKNACEAAAGASQNGARVRVSAQAIAGDSQHGRERWFVVVLVENPGGPIPPARLAMLNAPDPRPVSQDSAKEGSTGIGIFVTRYQLQNVIGQGADVAFLNTTGGVVQARLRLPARLLEEELGEVRKIEVTAPTEDYVLYVEDSRTHYEPLCRQLDEILARRGLSVHHCADFETADLLVHQRLPRFVLSDLSILRTAGDGELASLRNGEMLIRRIMELGAEEDQRPPLLILTAETEAMVREGLGGAPDKHGYRFIASAGEVSAPGTIRVLSAQKRELQAPQKLKELVDSIALGEAPTPTEGPARRFVVEVETPAFDLVRAAAELRPPASPRSFQLYLASAAKWSQLAGLLEAWFRHPGVPDPDPLPGVEPARYGLTNHVYLRRLLLAVAVTGPAALLSVRFRYWGLSKNLWLVHEDPRPQELADDWIKLRHEARGPFSTLRHDLLNQWTSPALAAPLDDLLGKINACEQLVTFPEGEKRTLETLLLHEKSGKGTRIAKLAAPLDGEAKHVVEAINAVVDALQVGRQREPLLTSTIDAQCGALYGLRVYLGSAQ